MAVCKIPISNLPQSDSLDGNEVIPVVEGDNSTKQSQLKALSGFVNLQYVTDAGNTATNDLSSSGMVSGKVLSAAEITKTVNLSSTFSSNLSVAYTNLLMSSNINNSVNIGTVTLSSHNIKNSDNITTNTLSSTNVKNVDNITTNTLSSTNVKNVDNITTNTLSSNGINNTGFIVTDSLTATSINAISSFTTYQDILIYELSGFDITGSISVSGNTNTRGITVDGNTIHVDHNSNKVGINTTTPNRALTIFGDVSANNSLFINNSATIDGFVGIGVVNPESAKLTIAGSPSGASSTASISAGNDIITSGSLSAKGLAPNYFAGKVGIGTSFPNETFTVAGDMSASGGLSACGNIHLGPSFDNQSVFFLDGSANKIGINKKNPEATLHITNEQALSGGVGDALRVVGNALFTNKCDTTLIVQSNSDNSSDADDEPLIKIKRGTSPLSSTEGHFGVTGNGNEFTGAIKESVYIRAHQGDTNFRGPSAENIQLAVNDKVGLTIKGSNTNDVKVGVLTNNPNKALTIVGDVSAQGDLNVDSDTLFVNATTDKVGINTLIPNKALTIVGDVSAEGDLNVDSDTFFVDASTDKVGINTLIPNKALTIVGDVSATGSLSADGSAPNYFTGSVGIGTTSPSQKLHVAGGKALIEQTGSAGSFIVNRTDGKSTALVAAGGESAFLYDNSGCFSIQAMNKSTVLIGNSNSACEVMMINGSGNVGINTSIPNKTLTVAGDISATGSLSADGSAPNYFTGSVGIGTTAPSYELDVNGTINAATRYRIDSQKLAEFNFNTLRVGSSNAAHRLGLMAGADERLTIDSAGNVGIGTVSPNRKLSVVGDISATDNLITTGNISVSASQSKIGLNNDSLIDFNGDLKINSSSISHSGVDVIGVEERFLIDDNGNNVVEFGNSGDIRMPQGNVFIDKANAKVGIRTGSPNEALTVVGNISAQGSTFTSGSANIDGAINFGVRTSNNTLIVGQANSHDLTFLRGESDVGSVGVSVKYLGSGSDDENIFEIATDNGGSFKMDQSGDIGLNLAPADGIDLTTAKACITTSLTSNDITLINTTGDRTIKVHNSPINNGGDLNLLAADSLGNDGDGGDVCILAGGGHNNGLNGHVIIESGLGSSGDPSGDIELKVGSAQALNLTYFESVFNEGGIDLDFRVESDNNTSMLHVDAANDKVGIGTASPSKTLSIAGDISATGNLEVSSISADKFLGGKNNTSPGSATFIGGGSFNTASGIASLVGGGSKNTASGEYSTLVGGFSSKASGNRSFVGGGFINEAKGTNTTIAGGYRNLVTGGYATIGGGFRNSAPGGRSTIGGGRSNCAAGDENTIGGGHSNRTTQEYSTVGGGYQNHACACAATVAGGYYGLAIGEYSTVGGGRQNKARGSISVIAGGNENCILTGATRSAIAGGTYNKICNNSIHSFIGGGNSNSTLSALDVIVGGTSNTASGSAAFIGGGLFNTASNKATFIGGGNTNTASGKYATVVGGSTNLASGYCSTIVGGFSSKASCQHSFVGGGQSNETKGNHSFVGGGCKNLASGGNSVVAGGNTNKATGTQSSVGGGKSNLASGSYSTVVGGSLNQATGTYSIAGAYNNRASALATVAFGENNLATSNWASIGGGIQNCATANESRVGGGCKNKALGNASFVGGGQCNHACSICSFVGGGYYNRAGGNHSALGGGCYNYATGNKSFLGGGAYNCSINSYSTVAGGYRNHAQATKSAVAGGYNNCSIGNGSFIGGGGNQKACGNYSTIAGGKNNLAKGNCSNVGGGAYNCSCGTCSFIGSGKCNEACGNSSVIVGGTYNVTTGVGSIIVGGGHDTSQSTCVNCAKANCSGIIGGKANVTNTSHNFSFIVGTGISTVSGNMLHANTLFLSAGALPTSDPGVEGVVWRDGATLKISV
jgi:hypothetical protein